MARPTDCGIVLEPYDALLATVLLTVPADHPSLPGHFPGHAVVPGVVVLSVVFEALSQRIQPRVVTGIKRLKFLQPLLPGQSFRLEFAIQQGSTLRFQCWLQELLMVEGQAMLTMANFPRE